MNEEDRRRNFGEKKGTRMDALRIERIGETIKWWG